MGCLECKLVAPNDYANCKEVNHIPYRGTYYAPCGMDFFHGSNYTPPKKKKKRK